MERKVFFHELFRPNVAKEWLAQHIEPMQSGIIVVVTCTANFSEPPGRITPMVQGSINIVTHSGYKVLEIESPPVPFEPKSCAKQFNPCQPVSIGGQKLALGFGGKLEERECGWVPKCMYIKIAR